LEIAPKYYQEQKAYRQSVQSTREGSHAAHHQSQDVPLLGRIAAGAPVEAIAGEDTLSFSDFTGDPNTYALKVRGESMIEDHICDGDYVLIEKTTEARNGDIVVALVDGSETTLKRFYNEPGGKVRLQPANATMQPIVVERERLQIQGKLIAVHRRY
jgi:repressor LexA